LNLYRTLFPVVRAVSLALGSLGTRHPILSLLDRLARRAHPGPEFVSFRNRWGHLLNLSYGYDIDRWILLHGTYDHALHRFIEHQLKPGMLVMDVGANLAEVALHMAERVRPAGKVYAFEPISHIYQRLLVHISQNQQNSTVQTFSLALANQNGPMPIAFADVNANHQGMASLVNLNKDALSEKSTVFTQTIDDFTEEHRISRIDFMKIDVQGGEWLLLEGGHKVFAELGPDLLIEVSPFELQDLGKNGRDLVAFVESFGYRVYELKMNGWPGERLRAWHLPNEFAASNVYCTKR
jgi:FkbM family methyltransferase